MTIGNNGYSKLTNTIYKSEKGHLLITEFYNRQIASFSSVRELYLNTSFGMTYVINSGKKHNPPLVLLHGSGSNSLTWIGELEKLEKTYNVFCIDIPGEPGKSEPSRFSTHDNSFTQWIDEVLKELSISCPVIGGLSLGGWAAIRYAIDKPHTVKKIIALAPAGIIKPKPFYLFKLIYYSLKGENGIRKLMSIMFDSAYVPEEIIEFQLLLSKHFNYRFDSPFCFTDNELKKIKIPFVYVCGKNDFIFNAFKCSSRLKKMLPDSQTVLLEKGHVLTDINEYL